MNKIHIFSNGSQYADWQTSNCYRCTKFSGYGELPTCEIDEAIGIAYLSDGTVSQKIATRAGYDPERYVWCCGEVEWTEEWIAEKKRMIALEILELNCILTIEQIKELRKLLPSDEMLERVCELSNSYGYEEIRRIILKGKIEWMFDYVDQLDREQ